MSRCSKMETPAYLFMFFGVNKKRYYFYNVI